LQQVSQHSQQAWIISQHLLSPLVQVMQQPSLVFSQRQWPQQNETLQHWMPFQVQQQEQVPSQRAWHRLCSVAAETWSGQRQLILQPVLVFSNDSSHRGTTHTLPAGAPMGVGLGAGPVAKAPRVERSVKTALDIYENSCGVRASRVAGHRGGVRRSRILQPRYLWITSRTALARDKTCLPETGQRSRTKIGSTRRRELSIQDCLL